MVVLTPRFPLPRLWATVPLVCGLACGLACGLPPASAQQSGYGQTMGTSPMEQQLYNYDPGSGSRPGGSAAGINPANPLDLINKIRKGSAMDDATPPGDAVDQALKALEAQSRPQPAGATAATP